MFGKNNPPIEKNIQPPASDCLGWDCQQIDASLDKVYKYSDQVGRKAIDWYWHNKRWKQLFSRAIQLFALVFAAAGGVVPIATLMLRQYWGIDEAAKKSFDTGLAASLFVGLAAALLGLDKAFGFSTGWARYVLTATTIEKSLLEFHLDWTSLRAACCGGPTPEQVAAMILRAKEFISLVEGSVLQETKEWVTEFQANMTQLEKDVKVQLDTLNAKVEQARQDRAAADKRGSLELTVPDADTAVGSEFLVTLEPPTGALPAEKVSNTKVWVKTAVPPGHCKITVTATVAGKTVSNQAVVDIPPGEIFKASVPLQS
ncbi:MAG: SLATT domain-containing protein [Bryobacteraceae bacterium]